MGVFDKIKNALFEEEYVEVEEKPKAKPKAKRDKPKKENKESVKVHENKPIAKKIVLPSKKEEVADDFDDYKPKDEDFEIVPDREEQESTSEFRFPAVDDREFEENEYQEEPKIVGVVKEEEIKTVEQDNLYQGYKREAEPYHNKPSSVQDAYHGRESNLYHSDYNDSVSIHEYGTYEKEKKPVFKPSPIISPIYGILDKNYKKEEIVPKREVRLTSYTREHMSVDDVRRKAYGNLAEDIAADIDGKSSSYVEKDVKEELDDADNLLVDLSSDDEKPRVSEVTVGDAEEYFRDLGLEYNIDYKDSSKEKATGRRANRDYDDADEPKHEQNIDKEVETKKEKTSTDPTTDDNLFDLIDSMYEEEEKE